MIYQSKWCFSIRASPNDLSPNDLPIQMIFQSEWFFSPNDFSVLMIFQSKWSQSKWSQSKQFPSPNDPSPVDPSPINPSLNDSGPFFYFFHMSRVASMRPSHTPTPHRKRPKLLGKQKPLQLPKQIIIYSLCLIYQTETAMEGYQWAMA